MGFNSAFKGLMCAYLSN